MPHKLTSKRQMSDAMVTIAFLTISGGLQDSYSYFVRGKVFANAQTGNIVLMSGHIFAGEWASALRYFIPLLSFMLGVFVAEQIHIRFKHIRAVHWRQLIVIAEILMLFCVGFMPQSADLAANCLTSFACAMQVQTFRKVNGYAFASTMCIGNLRSGVEVLSAYFRIRDKQLLEKSAAYFGVILLFAIGAGIGSVSAIILGQKAIWLCCLLLFISFLLMCIREEKL